MAVEQLIFDILPLLPATSTEIAKILNKRKTSIVKIMRRSKANSRCHIGRWDRPSNGPFAAVWYEGPGEDVECLLKHLGRAETKRRHKAKMQAKSKKTSPFAALFSI